MNELTDEDSMLEKAVLENDSFDLDTKLRIILNIFSFHYTIATCFWQEIILLKGGLHRQYQLVLQA